MPEHTELMNAWAEPRTTPDPDVSPEIEAVICWRFEELLRAGFERTDAEQVAFHFEIDLHDAADLVRRGCPSGTAREILL